VAFPDYLLKFTLDAVQNGVVHFQGLEDGLVRVLESQLGKVCRNLTPSGKRATPVRRSQENDEFAAIAASF